MPKKISAEVDLKKAFRKKLHLRPENDEREENSKK